MKCITLQLLAPGNSVCVSGSVFHIPVCQTERDWTSSTQNVTALSVLCTPVNLMASNKATKVTHAAGERAGVCDLDHPEISLWHPVSLQFVCYGSVSAAEWFLLFQAWWCSLSTSCPTLQISPWSHFLETPWQQSLSNPWSQGTWVSPCSLLA